MKALILGLMATLVMTVNRAEAQGLRCDQLNRLEPMLSQARRLPPSAQVNSIIAELEGIRPALTQLIRDRFLAWKRAENPAVDRHFSGDLGRVRELQFVESIYTECRMYPSFDIYDAAVSAFNRLRLD